MSFKRRKKKLDTTSKKVQYELAVQLNKMCKVLDKRYQINYGGCCYLAYCIAELLEKDGFNFSLVVFDDRYDMSQFTELSELPETMMHYAIVFDDDSVNGDLINCDDDDFDYSHQSFKVSAKDIMKYYNSNPWNSQYSTACNGLIKLFIECTYHEFADSIH